MNHCRLLRIPLLAALLAVAAPAQPGTALPPEQRRALEQLALADARSRLLEAVRALPLAEAGTVGRWAAAQPQRDRALRLWARAQPRHGRARIYSDAVCEADIHVTAGDVRQALARSAQQLEAPGLDAAGLPRAARGGSDVWVTGRATLPSETSARKPLGWENVMQAGLELARRAALADAAAALLDAAAELEVPPDRRLRGFIESNAAVRASLRTAVERAAAVSIEFEPDHVVLARATLPLRDLLRILTDVHQEHARGGAYVPADFRAMLLAADRVTLEAVGFGVPESRYVVERDSVLEELDAPVWAGQALAARGEFRDAAGEELSEEARREAARADALDRLGERVRALEIRDGLTVGAFLAYHQHLKADVVLWLSGARPLRSAPVEGGVAVEVELPARRLWEILRSEMQRRAVD